MQKQTTSKEFSIKKLLLRILLFVLILASILIAAVLNPGLFYKHKTTIGRFKVYSVDILDAAFALRLQDAVRLTEKSEIYNPAFHMDVCLGESTYVTIIKYFFGNALAWGFYNKVVIKGKTDSKNNLHESRWNLSQLLAHEMTHCLQYNKLGLFRSNPLAGYPDWKWEGYAEYVARAGVQEPLMHNIERLLQTEQAENTGWIALPDSTLTNLWYYKNWLLVKYCLDTKKMSYLKLLKDTTNEYSLRKEMMMWYTKNH